MKAKKILVLRFSSIGDIVLTTPILRSLKKAQPSWELHYFTKPAYQDLLKWNPNVDKLHLLQDRLRPQIRQLRKEEYDVILDLHRNLRTFRVKMGIRAPAISFDKKNFHKYMLVRKKRLETPIPHVVERYGDPLASLDIPLDTEGLDFFLPPDKEQWAKDVLKQEGFLSAGDEPMLAVVLGAKFATKRWIPEYFVEVLNELNRPILLLGGADALEEAAWIRFQLSNSVRLFDAVGKYNIPSAAALMKQCSEVLTHDTGFMHIAAAFRMKVHSIWGSTVPELGMTPYRTEHTLISLSNISCRPCSKIGYNECPKGHFRCMKEITPELVLQVLRAEDS